MDTQNYDETGSDDEIQSIKRLIRQSITRYLAQREHGFKEIISKLTQKGFSESLSKEVLENFRDRDWQSDIRFAEMLIKRRIDRGYGSQYIIAECRSKGIGSGLVQQILESMEIDWYALAAEAATRKFGDIQPKDIKEQMKRQKYLSNRGFNVDEIRAVYGG